MDNNKIKYKFSFVVPFYNSQDTLCKCIDSILNQDYDNYEIILVNNNSTDRSVEICKDFLNKYKHIKLLHEDHQNPNSARLKGVKNSSGEYIICVDSDDWIDKKFLNETLKILKQNKPDMIIYKINFVYDNDIETRTWETFEPSINIKYSFYSRDEIMNILYKQLFKIGSPIHSSWGSVFKKKFLLNNFCTDMTITYGEDFCTLYNCLFNASSLYISEKALYYYRQNKNSLSHRIDQSINNIWPMYNYIYTTLYGKNKYVDYQIDRSLILKIWEILFFQIQNCNNTHKHQHRTIYKKLKREILNTNYDVWNKIDTIKYKSIHTKGEKIFLFLLKKRKCWLLSKFILFDNLYWKFKQNKHK